MGVWLIVDVPNIAYRSYFAMGGLSYEGSDTSVPYGVFRLVQELSELFVVKGVIWCFDEGRSRRADFYPEYKTNRRKDENMEAARKEVREQLSALWGYYLPEIGYQNVQSVRGYEADDLIAAAVLRTIPRGDSVVIVGTDSDLFQLLSPRTKMWIPGKGIINEKWLLDEYGVHPMNWPMVKAIAGCSTDNVTGVKGVGEKRAASYINGTMKPKSVFLPLILKSHQLIKRNLDLVKLPLDGTPEIKVVLDDEVTDLKWNRIMDELGITSLS